MLMMMSLIVGIQVLHVRFLRFECLVGIKKKSMLLLPPVHITHVCLGQDTRSSVYERLRSVLKCFPSHVFSSVDQSKPGSPFIFLFWLYNEQFFNDSYRLKSALPHKYSFQRSLKLLRFETASLNSGVSASSTRLCLGLALSIKLMSLPSIRRRLGMLASQIRS